MNKTYTYFTDAGHGWLKVSLPELRDLGIVDSISACSYLTLTHAYLEEDCDLPKFIKALDERGITYKIKDSYAHNSSIRGYGSYSAHLVHADIKPGCTVRLWNGCKALFTKEGKNLLLKLSSGTYKVTSQKFFEYVTGLETC